MEVRRTNTNKERPNKSSEKSRLTKTAVESHHLRAKALSERQIKVQPLKRYSIMIIPIMEVYLDRRELHNCFKRLPIIIAAVDADKDKEQHQKQSEEKKSAPLSNVKDSKNNNTADTYPTQQPLQNHSQQSTCQPKQRQNHPLHNSTNTLLITMNIKFMKCQK